MVEHLKIFFSRTKKALRLNLGIRHQGLSQLSFFEMMILGWSWTVLWYDQICVLVAVAILEEVAWHLQICNSYFYQVSKSWPIGLLFVVESSIKICFSQAVIAASVKPCIVIVCKIIFKHALWPGVLDLEFALHWLCHGFKSSIIKLCFSAAVINANVKPCIEIVLDILFKAVLWHGDLDYVFQWLCPMQVQYGLLQNSCF